MRYHALACDYDETIALDGRVSERTIEALENVRKSGRQLILVTGRELDDLCRVFPRTELFDRIVAENGAVVYHPAAKDVQTLAQKPPDAFVRELMRRGVERVSVGRVIVATREPHETTALEVIRDFGLELQVVFNKGAVMILPSGVNKASGLRAALKELGLSPHNVVGVGDAENDHAFLALCECAVAVQNALPTLKERADWVTSQSAGNGVTELVQRLTDTDLSTLQGRLHRQLCIGKRRDGRKVCLEPYGHNVLITGTSGGGKSTLAMSFLERLEEQAYQFLILDPEGDYPNAPAGVVLGNENRPPSVAEVMEVLAKPEQNATVNMVALTLEERPKFFEELLPRVQELRSRTGRPHWIILDESHHLLPSAWEKAEVQISPRMANYMLITLESDRVLPSIVSRMDIVIAVGEEPARMLKTFTKTVGEMLPDISSITPKEGTALIWLRNSGEPPFVFEPAVPAAELLRHRRKYAEGDLPPDQCFYFRGPKGTLNLRAQNLTVFVQIADGIDDETWLFHLRNGDIPQWFRDIIKDPGLAREADSVKDAGAHESLNHIRSEIERRYILAS
jgi:HAD superfamily hydrolase (TIGR01484 family)